MTVTRFIKAMLQSDEARADQMASQGDIVEATPPEYNVTKTFPPRGDWTQYRLAASSRFSYSSAKSPKLQSSLLSREEAGVNSAVMDAMGPLVLRYQLRSSRGAQFKIRPSIL